MAFGLVQKAMGPRRMTRLSDHINAQSLLDELQCQNIRARDGCAEYLFYLDCSTQIDPNKRPAYDQPTEGTDESEQWNGVVRVRKKKQCSSPFHTLILLVYCLNILCFDRQMEVLLRNEEAKQTGSSG